MYDFLVLIIGTFVLGCVLGVGYKAGMALGEALLENGFLPHGEVWTAEGWFAKVREDKK